MSYAGYEIGKSFDREKSEFVLEIKKNEKTIVNIDNWWNSGGDMTKIGVFPFLGKDNKKLIVMQYSGGSGGFHTCKIYDLIPDVRIIHDDEEYRDRDGAVELYGGIYVIDINRDGKYQIVRRGTPFGISYVANVYTVYPKIVLSYDSLPDTFCRLNDDRESDRNR